jgi:hypothetical protein
MVLLGATLAMDMNETYLEMDNADYTYGTLYKVKVIVTDGINSNSSESNGTFTIIPPPSVSVESISELYSLDSLEVFEGVVLNDGGQTLPELAWMFGTGLQNVSAEENVSLGLNERLFVIFEHNYSSGGNMNVSLFAYDNNQSVNDTYSTMILVGDLRIGSSQELWSNSTLRHFETVISNDGVSTLSGISWNVSTGDLNVSGTEDIDLGSEEGVFLIFEHEYADSGDYLVELAASDGFSTVGDAISVEIPDISVEEFQLLSQLDEAAIFEIKLKNDLNDPMNASWVLDTGDEVVQSNSDTLLGVGERVFVLVEHEYGSFGDFTAVVNASDGSHIRQAWFAVSMNELIIENLAKLTSNNTLAVFTFNVENQFSNNRTFNWSFDTADGVITGTSPVMLTENLTFLVEHNYSSLGNYNVTASANTSAGGYAAVLGITI